MLITGGAGFIGSHVVDACCDKGWSVICIDSLDQAVYHHAPEYLRKSVDYCFSDLRYCDLDSRFDDVNAIVHLAALGGVSRAAKEPANIMAANVVGTARLLEASTRWTALKKIVHASSFSVYGANYTYRVPSTGQIIGAVRRVEEIKQNKFDVMDIESNEVAEIQPATEVTPPNPLEAYGTSKYMQELCYRGYMHCSVKMLRFSSVYGERLRLDDGEATIIAQLAGWIRSGQRPKLFEDGKQVRDWVFVGDVVAAIIGLLEGKKSPPIVNVCSGEPTTLLDACEILQKVIGIDCKPEVVGGFRIGDMRDCLGEPSEFMKLIGRKPLSFRDGARHAFGKLNTPANQ